MEVVGLRKKCYWDVAVASLVKPDWEDKAKERYRQYIHNMCSETKNPTCKKRKHLPEEVWIAWNAIWNSDDFKKRSTQNKINRRGGVADGPALPTHNSGSASHQKVAEDLEKKMGYLLLSFDLFRHTHTRNHDQETSLVDRAKKVHDTFITRREELTLLGEEVDDDQLFYEVVGGHDRKIRLYGLGSYRNFITSGKGSSETYTSSAAVKDHLKTKEKIQDLEERYDDIKQQLAQAMVIIRSLGEKVEALTKE